MNREEKKRSGLAALLFRFGIGSEAGTGAAGAGLGVGAGGAGGGLGGLLGAGISGGLLATKAGIIGLVLVGTTVAGSLGVVAYKLFGPTEADRSDANFTSLFAPKPQNEAGAGGQNGSASANGASKSLQFLVDANTKEAPPQDQTAEAAAASADASASAAVAPAAPPPLKNDNFGGSTIAKLKTDRKFGDLTKGAASGSAGSISLAPSAGPGNAALLARASQGGLSANPSRAQSSGLQALRSGRAMRGSGALKQLSGVRSDHRGATTSQGSGARYDGANPSPAASPNTENTSTTGQGASDTSPGVNPGGGSSAERQFADDVPAVKGKNVTPWQAAINTAMMLVMASSMILFLASKVADMQGVSAGMAKAIIILLGIIAAGLAAKVIQLGAEIGGGKFGQQLQGQMLTLAGGCLMATAAVMIFQAASAGAGDHVKPGDNMNEGVKDAPVKEYGQAGADKANAVADQKALATAMGGNTHLLMMVCGGAALAATAWAYMAPKKSYEASLFKDGRPPDWDHPYQSSQVVTPPSQGILDQYLV
ncbi:MAG: hypothetical protein PHU21_05355 [Elusimicrobia bacterium]|nr:hypothetical protein [Elusimicrobiota bacterium]